MFIKQMDKNNIKFVKIQWKTNKNEEIKKVKKIFKCNKFTF